MERLDNTPTESQTVPPIRAARRVSEVCNEHEANLLAEFPDMILSDHASCVSSITGPITEPAIPAYSLYPSTSIAETASLEDHNPVLFDTNGWEKKALALGAPAPVKDVGEGTVEQRLPKDDVSTCKHTKPEDLEYKAMALGAPAPLKGVGVDSASSAPEPPNPFEGTREFQVSVLNGTVPMPPPAAGQDRSAVTASRPGAYSAGPPGEAPRQRDRMPLSLVSIQPDGRDLEAPSTHPTRTESNPVLSEAFVGLSEATPVTNLALAEEVEPGQLEPQASKKQKERQHQKTWCGLVAISLALLAIGLGVGMGFRQKKSQTDITILPPSPMPSSAPTTALELLLQGLPESTLENIYTEDTPQEHAFAWLSNHPNITNLPQWKMRQIFALTAFYYALEGPSWPEDIKSTWLDYGKDECSWINTSLDLMYGLSAEYLRSTDFDFRQCNDAGEIQTIFLLHLGLSSDKAFIPPELALLPSLTVLSLIYSGISALLSDMFPSELTQLSNLQVFNAAGNSLFGTMPKDIGLLSNMRYLFLNDNRLTGVIPTELGTISNVKLLDLSANSLSGAIPSELGLLTSMTDLDLFLNSFSGNIPTELGDLSSVLRIYLVDNSLSGPIPSEFGLLSSLLKLHLSHNFLSGTVPSALDRLVGNGPYVAASDGALGLGLLSIEVNDLSGVVPEKLCLLQPYTQESSELEYGGFSDGVGLLFDCNGQLCGCSWCNCSETEHIFSNKTV